MSVRLSSDLEKWISRMPSSCRHLIIETSLASQEDVRDALATHMITATHIFHTSFAGDYTVAQTKHIRTLPFIACIRDP